MTYAGAHGKTAEEMAKTLHFDLPNDKLSAAFGALAKVINGDAAAKRGYQLSTANALWGQKSYPFVPAYLKLTKDTYGAGLHEVDFVGAAEQARQTINAWVEKETHDKIKDLLKQGDVSDATRLVLTNAIYFKGDWASKFKKDLTQEQNFHIAGGKTVKVPLMTQKGDYRYLDGGTFQALEMPYAGKEITMTVLLPKKADGLAELEKNLTTANLTGWLGKLHQTEVNVALPRFKVTAEFKLKPVLSKLGMPIAFSSRADFTGIATKEGLAIDNVIHKAYVDVNEEGTEAAAATAVGIKALAVQVVPDFRADHPFLFMIRDMRSGSVLFLGRLVEPK